jgi:hypothetical protein
VDVKSLAVKNLIRDGNGTKRASGRRTLSQESNPELPGYHGKGLYSSQGRSSTRTTATATNACSPIPPRPAARSANGTGSGDWQLVRRNQFTEVTGPGGIHGSDPKRARVEHRLGCEIAHPHAARWRQAWQLKTFSPAQSQPQLRRRARLEHRMAAHSRHRRRKPAHDHARRVLELPEDLFRREHERHSRPQRLPEGHRRLLRWNDRLVFGCDDSAKSEFLNKRKVKGGIDSVGQSQSNLWFTSPDTPGQTRPRARQRRGVAA